MQQPSGTMRQREGGATKGRRGVLIVVLNVVIGVIVILATLLLLFK
jgi:hypothetical protein